MPENRFFGQALKYFFIKIAPCLISDLCANNASKDQPNIRFKKANAGL